jgi:RNA polymerase sigma factor (sigma-70 family)
MASTYADELERLYVDYGRDVYRYVLALLRNPAEAEDVTQTTFLNAYRALQAGQEPQRPHNWLIAIAHNVCRSRVRFAMRRPKEVPLDDVVEQLAVPEVDRPNIRELLRTIRRLPFNQRAAITMRELEGRSYVDIAETLGVTVPAAEALIGRARRTLRRQAVAFRSLLILPLPRSLRRLAGNGEAAGGAVGTAAAAKIVALVVVGAVGGGVGIAAGSGSRASAPVERAAPARQPVPHASRAAVTHGPATRDQTSGVAAPGVPERARMTTAAVAATAAAAAATSPPAASSVPTPAAPAGTTPVVAGTVATGTTATTVTGAVPQVTQAVTTAVSELPTVTTPPVSTPAVTTPSVTTPSVTTPTVTTPTVTTPTATTPAATTPVATVPATTVPNVTVPSVTAPPVP